MFYNLKNSLVKILLNLNKDLRNVQLITIAKAKEITI